MEEVRPQGSEWIDFSQLIRLDSHIPVKAASPEYIFSFAYKKPVSTQHYTSVRPDGIKRPIPKTWEWVGTKNGTGLLDLPRELRDIIYGYVCHDMVHDGCGWRKEGEWADDTYSDDSDMDDSDTDDQEPIVFQNCNIMRICRQVHWEFAEVLYARPLQLTGIPQSNKSHIVITGSHILPLSRTYAHLVKKLAFIHNIDREDYLGLEPRIGGHFHAEVLWLDVVTATRELLKLFPTLQILRILVTNDRPPEEDVLMALLGKRTDRREELVEIAEDLIQAVRWSDTKPIEVPQQLELLYLEINGIVREMPLSEALRNTQAAELHKKELREKS